MATTTRTGFWTVTLPTARPTRWSCCDQRLKTSLVNAIKTLPEREHIMGMYYEHDGMNLKIAAVLGVTESPGASCTASRLPACAPDARALSPRRATSRATQGVAAPTDWMAG